MPHPFMRVFVKDINKTIGSDSGSVDVTLGATNLAELTSARKALKDSGICDDVGEIKQEALLTSLGDASFTVTKSTKSGLKSGQIIWVLEDDSRRFLLEIFKCTGCQHGIKAEVIAVAIPDGAVGSNIKGYVPHIVIESDPAFPVDSIHAHIVQDVIRLLANNGNFQQKLSLVKAGDKNPRVRSDNSNVVLVGTKGDKDKIKIKVRADNLINQIYAEWGITSPVALRNMGQHP